MHGTLDRLEKCYTLIQLQHMHVLVFYSPSLCMPSAARVLKVTPRHTSARTMSTVPELGDFIFRQVGRDYYLKESSVC